MDEEISQSSFLQSYRYNENSATSLISFVLAFNNLSIFGVDP